MHFVRPLLCFVFAIATLSAAQPLPAKLPVETFFKKPAVTQLAFSPNGKFIAALQPYKRRLNLVVVDAEKLTKVLVTDIERQDISAFTWVNDDRLVFQMDYEGDEGFGLYAVDRDGNNKTTLAATQHEQIEQGVYNPHAHALLGKIKGDPGHILVLSNEKSMREGDVLVMDVKKGGKRVLVANPGHVGQWLTDRRGVVRLGVSVHEGVVTIIHRAANEAPWETLATFSEQGEGWSPLGFDGDNRTLFVASDLGRKTNAIYRYDTVEKKMGGLVLADDTYDLTENFRLVYSEAREKVLGFFYHTDKPHAHWIDESDAKLQQSVDAALAGTFNELVELGGGGDTLLIRSRSDRESGVYYLMDLAKKKIREFAVVYPDVDPAAMAEMREVSFPARDGLLIHAYFTLPAGVPAKNLPLILNPHGGPFGIRDFWGYNPEVQLLANRGFAVLQVNYRGSGGYGREFERAGYKQWGLKMQDDLTDGVKWAIAQGFVDPQRVVIYGASYGGYATMAGLTFTPELYCAGINYVGVTDLNLRAKALDARAEMKRWHDIHVGRIDEDRKALADTSPVNFADRIRVPLLMAYGLNDQRVDVEHGNEMASAMKKAGRPYEIVYEKDEGHGFRKEEHTIAWYKKIDEFLAANVISAYVKVGPTQVIDSPVKARN